MISSSGAKFFLFFTSVTVFIATNASFLYASGRIEPAAEKVLYGNR